MRAAPAVAVDAHDDRLGRGAVALLVALSVGVVARWAWLWLGVAWEPLTEVPVVGLFVAAAAAVASGMGAWRCAAGAPVRLSWDGTQWRWQEGRADPLAGQAVVVFDLGRWLWIAFDPGPGPVRRARRRWRLIGGESAQALRAALFAAPRVLP